MEKTKCKHRLLQAVIILLCLLMGQGAHAQSKTIVVKVQNEPLPKVLRMIEKNTDYKFMFTNDDLNRFRVTKNINERDIHTVVKKLISGLPLTYSVNKNFIYITPDKSAPQAGKSQGRPNRVTGQVVDENGDPLMGATVQVVGKNLVAVADADGRFIIDGVSASDKLQISYLGMKPATVSAKDGVISMVSDNMIDDVIVTGYGSYNRGQYVGAVTQIKADDIKIANESTIDQMLQGVIPGMSVINKTGKVGGTPKIRIRGTSTLLGNQEPLWVVDGVIQTNPTPIPNDASPLSSDMDQMMETAGNAISWLNPADIETITVLKDASATAIYGTQASNGVIVITTKKAKAGSGFSINYSGSMSVTQKPHYGLYDMMNSQENMQFQQEMWEDRNSYTREVLPISYAGLVQKLQSKQISKDEFDRQFRIMESMNTDWFDILFRTPVSTQQNISVSSSGNKLSSRFSVGFNTTPGEAKGNSMQSLTASSNTTYRFNNRLSIDLSMNGSYRKSENFAFGVSPYEYAMSTTRTIPAYNDNGTYFYHEKFGATSYSIPGKLYYNYNILNERDNTGTTTIANTFQGALSLRWDVMKHLQFQGDATLSLASNTIKTYATEFSNYVSVIRGYEIGEVLPNSVEENASVLPSGGVLNNQNSNTVNYSFRGAFVYDNTFNKLHRLTFNLGMQLTSNKVDGNAELRYGYLRYRGETFAPVPNRLSLELVPGISTQNQYKTDLYELMRQGASVTNTKANTLSEYLTAVYSFDNRYVLNFNARLDASNRFGQDENKRFNPSFSLGGKWRIGEEHFMDWAKDWYDMFDISFAYGWRGNAVTAVSPYLIARDGGMHYTFHQYYLSIVSLPYPGLGWEKTRDWNLGVDFSFFDGRLSAGFNYYNKRSEVLSSREVAAEYGVDAAYIDGTVMKNRGYELIISATPIRTKDWTLSFSFNTSKDKNTVENNKRHNTAVDYLNGTAILDDEPYGTFYAWDFKGLDPETGYPTFNKMDVENPYDFREYLVKAGCTEPDISGGVSASLRYKHLHLRAQFAMSFGAQSWLPEYYASSGAPRPEVNVPKYMLDRWRKPGDELNTDIPSIPAGNPNATAGLWRSFYYNNRTEIYSPDTYQMYNRSTARIADSDFIRCRSLSLQYDLPKKWINTIGIRNAYVTGSLTNPFFIAFDKKWEGRDPETSTWPARKSFTLSLNLNF